MKNKDTRVKTNNVYTWAASFGLHPIFIQKCSQEYLERLMHYIEDNQCNYYNLDEIPHDKKK